MGADLSKKILPVLATALWMLSLVPGMAAGQSTFEPGAKAAGMGGAFVADADDTSALFYNPAGLAFLKGVHVKANLLFGLPTTSATWPPTGGLFRTSPLVFRGSFAMSWRFLGRVAIGVGFFNPDNLETSWPYIWGGSDFSLSSKMSPTYLRPALSVELFKGLSVGVGADFAFSKLIWTRTVRFPKSPRINKDISVDSREDLNGHGTGFTAGLLWKPHRAVQVGMNYRSRVPLEFTGRNVFIIGTLEIGSGQIPGPYGTPLRLLEVLELFYRNQDVTARLTMPRQMTAGLMLTPLSRLSLLFDAQWTSWSEFGSWTMTSKNAAGDLSPAFDATYRSFYGIAPDFGVQTAGLVMRDVWGFKAGLEYRPGTHFALRGGFARHGGAFAAANLNPVDPDLDQDVYSLGAGYHGPVFSVYNDRQIGELSFDVYLRYGSSKKFSSSLPGHEFIYGADSWAGGVGVGFNF